MVCAATAFASAGDAHAFDWMAFGRWTVLALCGMALAAPLVNGLRRLARLAVPALLAFLLLGFGIFATTPNGGIPTREEKERLRAEQAAADAERAALGSLLTGGERSCDATNESPAFAFTLIAKETNRVELAAEWTPEYVFSAIGLYWSRWIESNDWSRIDFRTDVSGETNCAWVVTSPEIVTNRAAFFDARGFLANDDSDADGIVAQREILLGLDPDLADTDGDLLSDGEELGFAEVLPADDFLWIDAAHSPNFVVGMGDAINRSYLDVNLDVPISVNDTVYRSVHATLDGHVYLAPQAGVGPFAVDWCDPSENIAFGLSCLAEGCISVFGCNADMVARRTTWGSGLYFDTVSTNGVVYDVVEFRNVGLMSEVASSTPSLTFQVIFPRAEPNVVYVSYLTVDPSLAALDMPLGVQCDSVRDFGDTNRYCTIEGPAPASGTTVRYRIGSFTNPLVADYDDYGIPLGYPRVTSFDADGDGLVDALDPEPVIVGGDFHGQSDAWVQATFTNAAEILSVGYRQWVDAQVGMGLTNGLYKLTVTVPDTPPVPSLLSVGDCAIVVTNSGVYAFLLAKCIDYDIVVSPASATNFIYSAVDDLAPNSGHGLLGSGGMDAGRWTDDRGELELEVPYGVIWPPGVHSGHVRFMAGLSVSPSTWQPSSLADTETFYAVVRDVPGSVALSYRWSTSDPGIVSIASPNLPGTAMTCHYPAAGTGRASLSLEVSSGSQSMHSYYVIGDQDEGENQGTSFTISAPDTLFVNDDDDDNHGNVDAVFPFVGDDDIVEGRMLLHSPEAVSGTLEITGVYGYDDGFAGTPLVYADRGCTDPILPGRMFPVPLSTDWSESFYMNPATVSQTHPGVQVRARWHPLEGADLTASKFLTIVSPVVEPICSATTNVVEDGVGHEYTVNPCGVGVGRKAYFRVEVSPESFPDDRIVWEPSPGLAIVGGNRGRAVTVRGVTEGVKTLTVHVGDSVSSVPRFTVRVVENVTVDLRAWIIEDARGNKPVSADQVRRMVKDANDIYAQVGVTLNLVEPIVVTNVPGAYNVDYDGESVPEGMWTYWDVVNMHANTGGLECYFINQFADTDDTKASHSSRGIVVTRLATRYTLAHEIGHAFGMCDIYDSNDDEVDTGYPSLALLSSEKASYARMSDDWNNGCVGKDFPGARYYRAETGMKQIAGRLLMLGSVPDVDVRRDITSGSVYGVFYIGSNESKVWMKNCAPIGFPIGNRNINHQ